jgi:hypothetical protein
MSLQAWREAEEASVACVPRAAAAPRASMFDLDDGGDVDIGDHHLPPHLTRAYTLSFVPLCNSASAAEIQALLLQASTAATKHPKKQQQQQQHPKPEPLPQFPSPVPTLSCTPIEWGEELEEVSHTPHHPLYEPISCCAGGGVEQERWG